ncbi:MAG: response regulator [Candidatus Riflebacteria bacterium]|nr:response regulator [Candidatus Riflebacteria bacterium]
MQNPGDTKVASRILIVDDDVDIVAVMSRMLELHGYKVLTAHEGKAALELVRLQTVDLVLLDLMMPVMDGFETLEMLQKQIGSKGIPVIILSAKGDKDSIVRALKMGAVDYIHKGADPEELLARVQVHLTLQKWRQKALADYGELIKKQMQEKYRIF